MQHLITMWAGVKRSIIDDAVDQWRRRLHVCIRARGQYFEYPLSKTFKLSLNLLLRKDLFQIITSFLTFTVHKMWCVWNMVGSFMITSYILVGSAGEIILKMGQHLAELWAGVGCPAFFTHGIVVVWWRVQWRCCPAGWCSFKGAVLYKFIFLFAYNHFVLIREA